MPTVEFPGRYESLAKIAELVQQASQKLGLDSCAAYAVETAVDEACSNIIEHSYGGEDKGSIVFTSKVKGNELIITLQDHGKKFTPKKIPRPDLDAPLKSRAAHGLGLYFIYQWMDEVKFDYVDGANVLTMVKRRGSSTP
jgi:serine/threonine-protein kinase RsbW